MEQAQPVFNGGGLRRIDERPRQPPLVVRALDANDAVGTEDFDAGNLAGIEIGKQLQLRSLFRIECVALEEKNVGKDAQCQDGQIKGAFGIHSWQSEVSISGVGVPTRAIPTTARCLAIRPAKPSVPRSSAFGSWRFCTRESAAA